MTQENEQLWQTVLGELELNLSKASFTTWFKNTFILDNEDGRIIIGVPNTFSQAWLKQKYHNDIFKTLQNLTGKRIKDVNYKVQNKKDFRPTEKIPVPVVEGVVREELISSQPTTPLLEQNSGAYQNINRNYAFVSFIVGKNNELAHAAAKAVAENPGFTYNPLFIYGGVGLGKTHLLQSIGNEILIKNSQKKILYVTCEQFTNDFINGISSGNSGKFQSYYRGPDVLLIDDIQFLTGKEGTQEAFFHTFNDLHQRNKQIVITSDRPPKAIATLEDRLLSRFEWGMIADISQPDMETRMAILEKKCLEKNFNLNRDIVQYITQNIQNNVRELEGALNKIIAYHQLNKIEPTLENIKKILFSLSNAGGQKNSVTPRHLIETVGKFYEIGLEDITGKCRQKRLAFPRQIIMYLMREELRESYPSIGQELGGRDHTTAMHAHSKILNLLETDEKLRQEINLLKQLLYQ
ncbi:MAG TPA: chromosomal replication initiator protein DnaA [Candidatus Bipolaricaulota bacterium]|nr:chromosomal replication initiator protein DnaA [Candidatus Bipolaricaulota bacterium]